MPGSSLRAAPWPLPWAGGSGQLRRQVPPPHRGQPPRDVSDGEARSSRRSAARAQRLRHTGERERARRGEHAPTVVLHLRVADREPRVRPEQGLQASSAAAPPSSRKVSKSTEQQREARSRVRAP